MSKGLTHMSKGQDRDWGFAFQVELKTCKPENIHKIFEEQQAPSI
jgi:hypothetical protein